MNSPLLLCVLVIGARYTGVYCSGFPHCADPDKPPVCPGNSRFRYEPHTTYTYDYNSLISAINMGVSDQTGRLFKYGGKAIITVSDSPCYMSVKLADIELPDNNNVDGLEEMKDDLQTWSVHFEYIDGRVSRVCKQAADSEWSVNVKLGLVSMLQNTMDRSGIAHEYDVNGGCNVTYDILPGGRIQKKKNVLQCERRKSPFEFQEPRNMSSWQTCRQDMENGVATFVTCLDEHTVHIPLRGDRLPFLYSRTDTTLIYKESAPSDVLGAQLPFDNTAIDIAYELIAENEDTDGMKNSYLELCDKEIDSPEKYAKLFGKLRRSSKEDITSLRQSLLVCETGLKIFDDLLLKAGTVNAIEVLLESLSNSEMYLKTFAMVERPTLNMIQQFKKILETERTTRSGQDIVFGCTMINNYRQNVDSSACSLPEVVTILSMLEDQLHEDCSKGSQDAIVSTLKAIENMGCSSPLLRRVLSNCYANRVSSLYVKLGTIQAFRLTDCSTIDASFLQEVMLDKNANSVLRTNAYLVILRCPLSSEKLNKLKEMLEREQDRHLGAFILSHLTKATLKNKAPVTPILTSKLIQSKFAEGFGGLSFFDTVTYDTGVLDVQVVLETEAIWSRSSNLPQSFTLRRIVLSLGEPVHHAEVTIMAHQLGDWIEAIFDRKFTRNDVHDKKPLAKGDYKPPQVPRNPEAMANIMLQGVDLDQFDFHYAMRFQGHDVKYGVYEMTSSFNPGMFFGTLLHQLHNGWQFGVEENYVLAENQVELATMSGMPLKFSINNVALVNAATHFRVQFTPPHIQASSKIRTSVSLGLNMAMSASLLRQSVVSARIEIAAKHKIDEIAENVSMSPFGLRDTVTLPDTLNLLEISARYFGRLQSVGVEEEETMVRYEEQHECKYAALFNALGLEYCEMNMHTNVIQSGGSRKQYIRKRGEYDEQRFEMNVTRDVGFGNVKIAYYTVPDSNQHFRVSLNVTERVKSMTSSILYGPYAITGSAVQTDDFVRLVSRNRISDVMTTLGRERSARVCQYTASVVCQTGGHNTSLFDGDVRVENAAGENAGTDDMIRVDSINSHLRIEKVSNTTGRLEYSSLHKSAEQEEDGVTAAFMLTVNDTGFLQDSHVRVEHSDSDGKTNHVAVRYAMRVHRLDPGSRVVINASYDTSLCANYSNWDLYYDASMDRQHSEEYMYTGFDEKRRYTHTQTSDFEIYGVEHFKITTKSVYRLPMSDLDCEWNQLISHINNVAIFNQDGTCGEHAYSFNSKLHHAYVNGETALNGEIRILYPSSPSSEVIIVITGENSPWRSILDAKTPPDSNVTILAWSTRDPMGFKYMSRLFFSRYKDISLATLQQDHIAVNGDYKTAEQVGQMMTARPANSIIAISDFLLQPRNIRVRFATKTSAGVNTFNMAASVDRRNATASVSMTTTYLPFDNVTLAVSSRAYGNRFNVSALARGFWSSEPSVLDLGLERIDIGWLVYLGGEPLFVSPLVNRLPPVIMPGGG